METFQQQKIFFDQHWPALRQSVESRGAAGLEETILRFTLPMERRILFLFARMGLIMGEWEGKNFGDIIAVAESGIRYYLAEAEAESSPEAQSARLDSANVISYNLAADLADCWPDDPLFRSKNEFTAGLTAAERCIAWRVQLGKGARPLSMAYWAKGYHEGRMAKFNAMLASMRISLAYLMQDLSDAAKADPASDLLLAQGYVALAEEKAGVMRRLYDMAKIRHALDSRLSSHPEEKGDLDFARQQLEIAQDRFS